MVKKAINDPERIVGEVIEGLIFASHGRLVQVPGVNAVMRAKIEDDKVALLIGGGSGHEPIYTTYVGPGFADAAACGNIFAAPSPQIIFEATKAIHRGKGVLYVYGNYEGDVMNFDVAAEMAAAEGIEVMYARTMDDVSLPKGEGRRGIAGSFFQVKIAGAACRSGLSLAETQRVTLRAQHNIRSLSVALRPGSLPETGQPTFTLGEDELEIGMGGHGERGVARKKMMPADQLVDLMMDQLVADFPLVRGDRVALLIDDLGATTMMELFIVNRRVRQILDQRGVAVHDTRIGPYLTTQEMAGFSITLFRLDEELARYFDQSASNESFLKA
jgi:phosphoenolpyruvate---glycerone phosphotransferase subunit DhaK